MTRRKTPGWIPPPAPTPQDWWDALAQLGHLHHRCQLPEDVERLERVERVQATILKQLMVMPPPGRQIDLIRHNAVVRHLLDGAKDVDAACEKASEDLRGTQAHGNIKISFQEIQNDEHSWMVRWPCAYKQDMCSGGKCQRDKRRKCGYWAIYWAEYHRVKTRTEIG